MYQIHIHFIGQDHITIFSYSLYSQYNTYTHMHTYAHVTYFPYTSMHSIHKLTYIPTIHDVVIYKTYQTMYSMTIIWSISCIYLYTYTYTYLSNYASHAYAIHLCITCIFVLYPVMCLLSLFVPVYICMLPLHISPRGEPYPGITTCEPILSHVTSTRRALSGNHCMGITFTRRALTGNHYVSIHKESPHRESLDGHP